MIYQNMYEELLQICKQITTHRQVLAKPRIEEMILNYIDLNVTNENLLSHLIAESLLKRIDRKLLESKNIFVQEFDIPQITLFYSMAEAVPFVYTGHNLANQYIIKATEGLKTFTIFDIGIGNGKQILQLLGMLAKDNKILKSVNVIGLDPFDKNIEDSGKAFEEIQKELPFQLQFYPICNTIENLSDNDYNFIRDTGAGSIIINSAFAFHHTLHPLNNNETRTNLLKKITSLKPLLLTIIEPNSNHDTEELTKRFHNCWQHFGNVFALVDESKIDATHKFLIKEKFFGREIRDIFGVSDHFRCERHELYDSWLLRLYRAGYKPFDFKDLTVELPDYCQYSVSEGIVRMDYNNITIVAVMAFSL